MQQITTNFKQAVSSELMQEKCRRGVADSSFLKLYGIDKYTCAKLLDGNIENIMHDADWLRLGRKLNVTNRSRDWKIARTVVFNTIEEDILFCKKHSKAKIMVDECGIGKTYTAKYLAATLNNCFYVDASQGKAISQFTALLAKSLGIPFKSGINEVKEDVKCYLNMIDNPIVIIDEAGDLRQNTLQELKEFWNATEYNCGWYLMGADSLKKTMQLGMRKNKPGFKEIFSRFSEKYTTTVPVGRQDKKAFYRKLIKDVLEANVNNSGLIDTVLKKCLIEGEDGYITGLRRAESLLILHNSNAAL